MKTLNTIQTLSKIGKILSKIIYICCIIGAVGCVVGLVCLPFADTGILKIGGVTIYGLIVNRAGNDLNSLYSLMTGAMIVCIGQAVAAKFGERYFSHELTAGTTFTIDGAKELFRLGIITICVPLGSIIFAQIVSAIVAEFVGCGEAFKLEGGDSVALGVMFIFMSLLCKYGAECMENKKMISIDYGSPKDVDSWMRLVRAVSSSFPGLETEAALTEHRQTVLDFMDRQEAVCAKQDGEIVGVLLFSKEDNMLCFLAVAPIFRGQCIAEKMFRFMLPQLNADKPVTVTTWREGVPEGIAARAFYQKLGFVPGKLTVEFGSEVQEFVLDIEKWQTY